MARNGKGWRGILWIVGILCCVGGYFMLARYSINTTMSRAGTAIGGETSLGTYYQAAGMGELADDGAPIKNPEEAETEDAEPRVVNYPGELVYELSWPKTDSEGFEFTESIHIWEPVLATDSMLFPLSDGGFSLIHRIEYPGVDRWVFPFEYGAKMETTGYGEAHVDTVIGASRPSHRTLSKQPRWSINGWNELVTSEEDLMGSLFMYPSEGTEIDEESYLTTTLFSGMTPTDASSSDGTLNIWSFTAKEGETLVVRGYITFVNETRKTPALPNGVTPLMFLGASGESTNISPIILYAGLRTTTPIVSIEMNEEGEMVLGDGIGTMFAKGFK